jgi:hypothetical protein
MERFSVLQSHYAEKIESADTVYLSVDRAIQTDLRHKSAANGGTRADLLNMSCHHGGFRNDIQY